MLKILLCACSVALAAGNAWADTLSEEVPVRGGTAALSRALGLDPAPDRARFITEIARVIYDNPTATTEIRLRELSAYLRSAPDSRTDTVPLPLSLKSWNAVVFGRPVTLEGLFSAVLMDRRAALFAHGLAAIDDETLQFLDSHHDLLERLYRRDSAAFALFGGSLRIRGNAVVLPGGDDAAMLWQGLVDEPPASPERFIRQLFGREEGRVAYLYDTASRFDLPTRAFLLGQWIPDPRLRLDRVRSLLKALAQFPGWTMPERSFRRPPNDPMLLVMRIPVEANGTPSGPSAQSLWSEVFDWPADGDGPIDAAWLAASILDAELQARRERIDQLAFGLRVFHAADVRAPLEHKQLVTVLRAFPRDRMLLLALERLGISAPATFAAAVQQDDRLARLNARDGYTAQSLFQGSLAMLVRLVTTHSLDPRTAEALVVSLCEIPIKDDRFDGGVARWIQRALVPALKIDPGEIDAGLIDALSGAPAANTTPRTLVRLEDGTYRLDLSVPEGRRIQLWLARLGAEPISRALAIDAVADRLVANQARAETQRAIGEVKQLVPMREWTPGGSDNPVRVAEAIRELGDQVLGDGLLAMAYALNMEAPAGTFAGGNLSRRHDFGLSTSSAGPRGGSAWAQPKEQIRAGVAWHVTGSLLGLDLALSHLALRRISADTLPGAPVLADGEKDVFTRTVALMNAFDLTDADRDLIATAIARGRQRVSAMTIDGDGLQTIADAIALDGARRRAVRWTLRHDPPAVSSFFSLTELLHLGWSQTEMRPGQFDAWGMAADAYDGCLCTRLAPPGRADLIAGRWPAETVATEVADLSLRVAVALAAMKLPAALAKGVLAAATQDFVDRVRPLYPYDWLTLVRTAQSLTDARIEDYVAALTADGPLVADGDGMKK